MKRQFLICILALAGLLPGATQELGVRFGDVVGNDFAIDAVIDLYRGRIHGDVSFGGNPVGVEILYDFLYQDLCGDRIYWYVGAGGFAGFGDPFRIGVSGEGGVEYRLRSIPLVVGFDWRPAWRIIDNMTFFTDRFGINVRWSFRRR